MKIIDANSSTVLALGRCGENLARKVLFDITDFEHIYGVGTVEVLYQRPNDAQPYPLAVQRDGTSIVWNVTSTDTAIPSAFGKCELRYYSGETLVKSKIWQTWVENALSTPSETTPPEPEQGWVDKVLAAGQAAVNASVNSPKIGDNGNWFVWDFEAGKYVDTGVAASGGGSGAVSSVNGKTGVVKLTAGDVGAVPVPETASVGQTIRVKAVSEAGKPMEWEAADMPSKDDWKKLVDVTTEEDASSFQFTFDDVSELIIMISGTATNTRINFYSDGITNFYHYKFLMESKESSNYLHVHKRIGGMRYMEAGTPSDETPDRGGRYALLDSKQSCGMLVRSVNDSINNLRFTSNTTDVLKSGARIQIFGR